MATTSTARPTPSSSSLASSMTRTEADVQSLSSQRTKVNHFKLVFDPAGVTPESLQWRYGGHGTTEDPYAVDFTPQDPYNPQEFTRTKKWVLTILTAFSTLAVAFASSAFSSGLESIILEFGVSEELSILGLSMFVVGFAVGPLLWAPLSEFYGRQLLYFFTYAGLVAFNAGGAGAPNFPALVVLRFFAGALGSSPLTNSGGVIADMFNQSERGIATAIFAAAPFLGPSLGPIAGGFLAEAAGWRWVEGMMAIFTGVLWIVCSLCIPETYAPVLLRTRAAKLSKVTGKVYMSKLDVGKHRSKAQQFKVALSRPWILLFTEPIVFLISIYMAIVYGTLYMMFPSFPIIFQLGRGWSAGIAGLAFLGITVGMVFSVSFALFDNIRYAKIAAKHNGEAPPEARLPAAIFGSILIPVGLFWFAWSNGPSVHWVVPIAGSAVFAAGIVLVFLSLMNYLVDSYVVFAASVLASNAVLRSLFGAAFPLFTNQMYANLGIHWAASVPAFLSLACVPFPIVFYKYGPAIRARCKFAAEAAKVLAEMRQQHRVIDESEAVEEMREEAQIKKIQSRASKASRAGGGVVASTTDAEAALKRPQEDA